MILMDASDCFFFLLGSSWAGLLPHAKYITR
jgi:hypothetical protein